MSQPAWELPPSFSMPTTYGTEPPSPQDDFTHRLLKHPRSYLTALAVALWRGEVQFDLGGDPRTSSRKGLVRFLVDTFPRDRIEQAMRLLEGDPAPHGGDGLTDALAGAVKKALSDNLSRDGLAQLVRDEVRKLPPFKLDLAVNNEPAKEIDGYARPEFREVLDRALHRINVLMVGPAGCGKTYIGRQVADALGLPFGSVSCSAGMSESHLTGWLIPRGEGGKFEYTPSVFVDIYENGGVFLFDELDAADSNTLLFVNQALANGGFFLPQRYDRPEVKKHPDCVILAAANTYGTGGNLAYAGRERLDEATIDRFRAGVVEVGYDATLEETLIDRELLDWGRQVRHKIAETKLARVMSTRFLLDASKLTRSGRPLGSIRETYFHGWREDERRKVA